ncbi:hypothetical protein M758_2G079600, partial [Ceratodon purpureus]
TPNITCRWILKNVPVSNSRLLYRAQTLLIQDEPPHETEIQRSVIMMNWADGGYPWIHQHFSCNILSQQWQHHDIIQCPRPTAVTSIFCDGRRSQALHVEVVQ